MRPKRKTLREIVKDLQDNWPELDTETVSTAIEDLKGLRNLQRKDNGDNPGYEYDGDKFPPLDQSRYGKYEMKNPSKRWDNEEVKGHPINLAEALLWKLGKWSSYKVFVEDYESTTNRSHDEENALVFYAFAKHLRDDNSPIFDQHAARALWAISPNFWKPTEVLGDTSFVSHYAGHVGDFFFHYLMQQDGEWRGNGGGDTSMSCLEYYIKEMKEICSQSKLDGSFLDKMLMPLGQALKDYSDRDNETGEKIGEDSKRRSKAEKPQVFLKFLKLVGQEDSSLEDIRARRLEAKRSIRQAGD